MLCVLIKIASSIINTQWLKLSMSRTNFHGPKAVQAIEVQLNANEENALSDCKDTTAADDILIFFFFFRENKTCHFTWNVYQADDSHEIQVFSLKNKYKKKLNVIYFNFE